MASKKLRKAVVRQVHSAVNRKLQEVNARSCFALICRDAEEIEQAMELFKRWAADAAAPEKAN